MFVSGRCAVSTRHPAINVRSALRFFVGATAVVSLSILVLLLYPGMASAQGIRVEGVVHDASGASVIGARVELRSKSYSARTSTNSTGTFAFGNVPDSSGTIDLIAPNFKETQESWSAASDNLVHLEVTLEPASVSEQVFVTAARTSTPVGEIPESDIQLTSADLQATPALTLDDALRQVPGFSLFRRTSSRTANPTTLGVSLRGLGANGASRVLVLEDGIPLNDPFGSWVYWDRVPTESVESVEISQGGASSLYGSDALGGVLQFITRPAQPAGLSLETSYGNQNSADFSVSGGGQAGQWESTFAGEAFQTDGYNLVPEAYRGRVDTNANSEHGAADLMVGRKIGDSGSEIFARGWYLNDSRNNGTRLQFNNISLGEGALGANLQ